jgi:hypothetical protein
MLPLSSTAWTCCCPAVVLAACATVDLASGYRSRRIFDYLTISTLNRFDGEEKTAPYCCFLFSRVKLAPRPWYPTSRENERDVGHPAFVAGPK